MRIIYGLLGLVAAAIHIASLQDRIPAIVAGFYTAPTSFWAAVVFFIAAVVPAGGALLALGVGFYALVVGSWAFGVLAAVLGVLGIGSIVSATRYYCGDCGQFVGRGSHPDQCPRCGYNRFASK